jgi:Mn-dependent DtxR family transcriptional regulator
MEQAVFTHKEASLLAAIESEFEFSLSQAAIWTNMGPHEVRELLTGLESRGLVRQSEGGRYTFTKEGLSAKRQLSQRSSKNFLISEEGNRLDSASVDSALGDAISRLE